VSSVDYAGWKRLLAEERLPAVVVDLDAFDRNVRKLAGYASGGGKRLRLATKSLRVPELIRRVLAAGAPYQGLMCYAAEEAARLREQGFDDLLVAYPTVRASDLALLRRLHEQGALVAATVDHVDSLRALAAAMKGVSKPFRFIADVDMSLRPFGGLLHLGVRRSPLHSARDVAALMDEAARHAPAVRFVGALAYEAQVAGLGDRNPFKRLMNPVFSLVRKISVGTVARIRRDLGELFRERGLVPEIFNGGGTGSIDTAAGETPLTELSAGSGLLCSHLFDYYSNVRFEPSCFFALQATRFPAPGFVTCLGGGYIASGEPGWDRVPRPYLPAGGELTSGEACGEVQTPVRYAADPGLALGDPVLFRHAKAGELAERFNDYLLVSGGRVVSRAKTYRGLGDCYF
jgi:D-serine deaminase-like pyridoxal phosphate-dependent protein